MYVANWYFEGDAAFQCFTAEVEVADATDVTSAVETIMQAAYDRAHQIMENGEDMFTDQWTWIDVFGECSLPFLADYGIKWETSDDVFGGIPEGTDEVFDSAEVIIECDGEHVWTYVQMAMPKYA